MYICHPSMANDNLSGMIMTTLLTDFILKLKKRKNTYRFYSYQRTIGAIASIKKNENLMNQKLILGWLYLPLVVRDSISQGFRINTSWNEKHYINNHTLDNLNFS